jgi:hypothetical protein
MLVYHHELLPAARTSHSNCDCVMVYEVDRGRQYCQMTILLVSAHDHVLIMAYKQVLTR